MTVTANEPIIVVMQTEAGVEWVYDYLPHEYEDELWDWYEPTEYDCD